MRRLSSEIKDNSVTKSTKKPIFPSRMVIKKRLSKKVLYHYDPGLPGEALPFPMCSIVGDYFVTPFRSAELTTKPRNDTLMPFWTAPCLWAILDLNQ